MNGIIRNAVNSFARDGMLRRTEDSDSLANLALFKLHHAIRDFKYNTTYTEEHNERRFIALAKTYIRNILIDQQYSANLRVRSPEFGLISTAARHSADNVNIESDDNDYVPPDHRLDNPYDLCVAKEAIENCRKHLDDLESKIFDYLLMHYNVEGIARKTGIQISRIRYLIYTRIQPEVMSNI